MAELRESWARVDDRVHVNAFIDMHDVGDALIRAGFADPVMETECFTLLYDDGMALMRELQQLGASNVNKGRPRALTGKRKLQGCWPNTKPAAATGACRRPSRRFTAMPGPRRPPPPGTSSPSSRSPPREPVCDRHRHRGGQDLGDLGADGAVAGQGLKVNGMKPVASGSAGPAGRLRNADATLIQAQSSRRVRYAWVNPYAFAEPIAPHIAAAKAGVSIDPQVLDKAFHAVAAGTDAVIVEGAGGWRSPLAADLQASDLARRWGLSVVLVVGLRLGCINHALLTAESIRAAGCPWPAGWGTACAGITRKRRPLWIACASGSPPRFLGPCPAWRVWSRRPLATP